MHYTRRVFAPVKHDKRYLFPLTLLLLTLFIASCGGSATSTAGSSNGSATSGGGVVVCLAEVFLLRLVVPHKDSRQKA